MTKKKGEGIESGNNYGQKIEFENTPPALIAHYTFRDESLFNLVLKEFEPMFTKTSFFERNVVECEDISVYSVVKQLSKFGSVWICLLLLEKTKEKVMGDLDDLTESKTESTYNLLLKADGLYFNKKASFIETINDAKHDPEIGKFFVQYSGNNSWIQL